MAVHVTTVGDVYENYTDAPNFVQFHINGVDDPIVEIGPATDGKGGFLLVDADGQAYIVPRDETMWMTGEKWSDDVQ